MLWFLIIQTILNYQLTIDMFGINLIIVIFWRSTLLYQLPFNILSNLYLHIGCNPNCLYFPQILHLMTNQFRLKDCAGCNSWCQNPTRRTINRKCYKPKITRYQFQFRISLPTKKRIQKNCNLHQFRKRSLSKVWTGMKCCHCIFWPMEKE